MKKTGLAAMAIAMLVLSSFLTSCSKEKDNEETTINEQIVGIWEPHTFIMSVSYMGQVDSDTMSIEPGQTMEFKADGTVEVDSEDGKETGKWSMDGDKISITELEGDQMQGSFDIDKLTSTDFHISITQTEQGGSFKHAIQFRKPR